MEAKGPRRRGEGEVDAIAECHEVVVEFVNSRGVRQLSADGDAGVETRGVILGVGGRGYGRGEVLTLVHEKECGGNLREGQGRVWLVLNGDQVKI